MTDQTIDQAQVEAFAGRLLGILQGGAQTLLISIGHQTGLFETLATLPPATSQQIAEAAGLNERYVREWLAGMVVSRLIDYAPAERTYALPPVHAALLTRAAGPHDMGPVARLLGMGASVEGAIVECFKQGGGVPYSAFVGLSQILNDLNGPVVDAILVRSTLPLVSGLLERLEAGIEVADGGCGSGHAVNVMAKAFPKSRFVGFDFSEESLAGPSSAAPGRGSRRTP